FARYFDNKTGSWAPRVAVLVTPLILYFGCVFLISFATSTPSFFPILLTSILLLSVIMYLPALVPTSWGTNHTHHTLSHRTYIPVFRLISLTSLLLHAKATLIAPLDNTPSRHRHSH